jgi:hypothetical protein
MKIRFRAIDLYVIGVLAAFGAGCSFMGIVWIVVTSTT